MKLSGNTIFITGGGSGIGRGLAEAFHKLGNQVIISGRRKGHLSETTKANSGMHSMELNIQDPANIAAVAKKLIAEYPQLNVLINNAGIMQPDNAAAEIDEAVLLSTITTNLLGPIRMTSALIEHLKKQKAAAVINVSSGLAFVPLAMTAIYCSTKAALHSYTQSMRYRLKGSSVKVLELVPLGAHRPDEQQQRSAGHAARGVHRRSREDTGKRCGGNSSGTRKNASK